MPTAVLVCALASDAEIVAPGARLGLVFGVDNLVGMASWEAPTKLLAKSDLVLIGRGGAGEGGGDGLDLQVRMLCL